MKTIAIVIATTAMLISAPAFARGGHSLNIGLSVVTGKGGVAGTLLGAGKHRNLGSIVNANVTTSKRGVLGLLLGGGRGHGGHHGCGC